MELGKLRISVKEVERMLGVGYDTVWHMHQRIGEAMKDKYQKDFLQALIGVTEVTDRSRSRIDFGSRFPPLWKDDIQLSAV